MNLKNSCTFNAIVSINKSVKLCFHAAYLCEECLLPCVRYHATGSRKERTLSRRSVKITPGPIKVMRWIHREGIDLSTAGPSYIEAWVPDFSWRQNLCLISHLLCKELKLHSGHSVLIRILWTFAISPTLPFWSPLSFPILDDDILHHLQIQPKFSKEREKKKKKAFSNCQYL